MGKAARERAVEDERAGRKRILFWGVAALILFGVVWVIFSTATAPAAPAPSTLTAPAITAADWTEGSATSSVTMVEYGDFECPACSVYYPIVKQVVSDYSSRVRFVFRNFPLTQHASALPAAQAAEAAGLQGKYWPMFDQLYTEQAKWSASPSTAAAAFRGYAQTLNLDMSKYDADVASDAVSKKIEGDLSGGERAGVDHTPTFFVNLRQVENPTTYAEFKSVLDRALASGS